MIRLGVCMFESLLGAYYVLLGLSCCGFLQLELGEPCHAKTCFRVADQV